ncbi:MAG: DUF2844 domain-containing protein [Betaproteobacteria bacterium]|nr:DUF2844 domain-containing protein [Betaproteobacteria bacterium]
MKSKQWLTGMALVMLAFPFSARAVLGGDVASVHSDRAELNAALRTTPANQFTQFDLQLPSGTTVREYVSATGAVFAVSWDGPSLPDLRLLLGSYFQQYRDAVRSGGVGARVVKQPGLVVYTGGHMRAFRGRAYVPQLLPPGVAAEEIR